MDELLTIRDLRRILGVSPGVIIGYVQRGALPAYRFVGGPKVDRSTVTRDTPGLRFELRDVRALMQEMMVK